MAERTQLLNLALASFRFRDYTATPLNHTPAGVIPDSVMWALIRKRKIEAAMSMGSSGHVLHAIIDGGESDEGSNFTLSVYLTDPKNTTDATTADFFRKWYESTISTATGFSSWVTTPTVTGGSNKSQVKLEVTVPDLGGTNHIDTFPVILIDLAEASQGMSAILNATLRIVGAIVPT